MNYYYYPLCSKDFTFENIFASESVSPPAFYKKRGFGMDFFYTIPKVHSENAILLFSAPPKFETGVSGSQFVKFVLKIKETSLDPNAMITISEDIIAYQRTIHFNKQNLQVLFFSESEKRLVCLKSETSLPTKGLKKYENNFAIISETDCKPIDVPQIDIQLEQETIESEISLDRKFNSFKGLVYGIACGLLNSKSPVELQLSKSYQEITNSFAELKNRAENILRGNSKYNKNIDHYPSLSYDSLIKNVQTAIQKSQQLFATVQPIKHITNEILANYLYTKFRNLLPTVEKAATYLETKILDDAILGTNNISKLKAQYIKEEEKSTPGLHFELLHDQLAAYLSATKYKADHSQILKERAVEQFKNSLFNLTQHTELLFTARTVSKELDLSGLFYQQAINKVEVNNSFKYLQEAAREDFLLITNTIIDNTKFGKGDASREQILSIVENVGSLLGKQNGKETHLYQYLTNEVTEYNIDKVSSIIMRNFVAFVFNPDSTEKLESFLAAKKIDEPWIAYSFWCLFNGFSNVSRNFTKSVFDQDNSKVQSYIDSFLLDAWSIESKDFQPSKFSEKHQESSNPQKNEAKNWKPELFFKQFLEGKYKISFEQFQAIIISKDKTKMIDELITKHRIGKRDATKLIEKYIEYSKETYLF